MHACSAFITIYGCGSHLGHDQDIGNKISMPLPKEASQNFNLIGQAVSEKTIILILIFK